MQPSTSTRRSCLPRLPLLLAPSLLGLNVGGCEPSDGTTDSGGSGDAFRPRVLWCGWKDPNGGNPDPDWGYGRKFCIKTGACNAAREVMCAYNVDNDEGEYLKYTKDGPDGEGFAVWDGYCDESCPEGVEAGRAPVPSCEESSDYDPNVYGLCEPAGPPPDPTTGGEPTTGADPGTDSDGPGVETWLCSEFAHQNCQDRSGAGINATDDFCWSTAQNAARCVTAATPEEAADGCNCLCSVQDTAYTAGCDSPGVCQVDSHFDCSAPYPDSPMPLGLSSHICEAPILDWASADALCPNNFKLFDASATLVLADGTSTAARGIVGYLHYTVTNCAGKPDKKLKGKKETCDLAVEVLEIPAVDLTGVYLQGKKVGGSYAFDNLGVRMKGTIEGTWTPSRQTVTFSEGPFLAVATMTAVSVDGVALPTDAITFGTNQIVGNLDSAASKLTLNFSFSVPGGTASLSLTTR